MILFSLLFCVLLLLIILTVLLDPNRKRKAYFESKGVAYIGGNTIRQLIEFGLGRTTNTEYTRNLYQRIKQTNSKVAWTRFFGHWTLSIIDLDIVKHITIKDFDHFANRQSITMAGRDPTLGKVLTSRVGEEWKTLRSKMSPAFTGTKLKRMFSIFDSNAKKLISFTQEQMSQSPLQEADLALGHTKMTAEVIASTVCGINTKSFEEKGLSIFEKMGLSTPLEFGRLQLMKIAFMGLFPNLANLLGFSIFSKGAVEFFTWIFQSSLKIRSEQGPIPCKEKRDDFIQLLLDARNSQLKDHNNNNDNAPGLKSGVHLNELLDDDSIVSNCFIFIFAGFDTTQSVLSYAAYSLAIHQDVQDKLREEILSVLEEEVDGEFTYDNLGKMQYLGMVINETLRMYSPVSGTNRICNEDYKIPGTEFVIKKGQRIAIPIIGFHHDKEYFPEPDKFDPERFANQDGTNPNNFAAYMPFGNGPRNCIGMRFAMMEIKLALGHLVKNFKIQPSANTLIPMKYSCSASLKPVGGMWLAFHKLN